MKSVLLPVGPTAGDEARLAMAIALVQSRAGHLICIQVLPPPVVVGDVRAAVTVPEMLEAMERTAREVQEEVDLHLEQAGVERTWLRVIGDATTEIVSHSRLADRSRASCISGTITAAPTSPTTIGGGRTWIQIRCPPRLRTSAMAVASRASSPAAGPTGRRTDFMSPARLMSVRPARTGPADPSFPRSGWCCPA